MRHLRLVCTLLIATLCAMPVQAQPVPPESTVGVMPLTFRYMVDQEYQATVIEADSYLQGTFKEDMQSSAHSNARDNSHSGMIASGFSSGYSDSAKHKGSGEYDLQSGRRVKLESYNDRTVVEKSLDSGVFTGILESALSEAGIRVADRSQLKKIIAEQENRGHAKTGQGQVQLADFLLNGQIETMRLEGVRKIPDGTNTRYSVGGVLKISIKLSDTRTGVADFARTFTGKARKTFESNAPVPADDVLDAAMDDLARQIVSALTGERKQSNVDDEDSEYQDSPGKRLKD